MWKDLPLTAILPAVIITSLSMWSRKLFELTNDALLVFVAASLVCALIRLAILRWRS
jgi:hypothetical protein